MTVRAFWPSRRLLGALTLLVAVVALAGCSSSDRFGPDSEIQASDAELANINAALLDARDRIAPELHTVEMIPTLQTRLTTLSENLLARRYQGTSQALIASRQVMDDSEQDAPPDDAPERSAIHLALDQVDLLLRR